MNSYWMTVRKKKILQIERGSIILHSLENSLWKRLWTCCETDCDDCDVNSSDCVMICMMNWKGHGKKLLWRNSIYVLAYARKN